MTGRERRTVAIGGALVLAAALLFRIGPAAAETVRGWQGALTARLELARRMQAELEAADQVEASARLLLTQMDSLAPRLVSAGGRAEGVAAFVMLVESRAGRHRARVLSSRSEADSARVDQVERLTLRVELESDLSGLIGTTRALEQGLPVVELRELRVRLGESGLSAPVEVLRAELLLSAWMLVAEEAR